MVELEEEMIRTATIAIRYGEEKRLKENILHTSRESLLLAHIRPVFEAKELLMSS